MSKTFMSDLESLFKNNRAWADGIHAKDPEFFARLSHQQAPAYLWIGCSDSRVPANEIAGMLPGELFVHRNVANVVVHTDLNCLSVLQYAVDVLHVQHVIVCGHYGCGGVHAAWSNARLGLIDNWLRHVQDVRDKHREAFDTVHESDIAIRRLCELNVLEQVLNVCETTIVQSAWERGQTLSVHGLIYGLNDGLLRNLNVSVERASSMDAQYRSAVKSLKDSWTRIETKP